MRLEIYPESDGAYFFNQLESQENVAAYVKVNKNLTTIPDDIKNYLDYNAAIILPNKIEESPVYFITSDVSHNQFKLDKFIPS